MSGSLIVLCLAAFAVTAIALSGLVGAALPWLDNVATRLGPRGGVRLWMGLAAVPAVLGTLTLVATLLPAVGLGSDHCLAHDAHHPHLCPHHISGTPGTVIFVLALFVGLRAAYAAAGFVRVAWLSRTTAQTLAQASDRVDDLRVFPTHELQAFVLGLARPQVHVSTGLLALESRIVEPVLAHERAHARHRDLLWRALCPVFGWAHLPWIASDIAARLVTAQEMAADTEAAEQVRDPVAVAEALVALAKLNHGNHSPALTLSFTHGDLRARVLALLAPRRVVGEWGEWAPRVLLAGCAATVVTIGAYREFIHHGLETLLGALS